jgi:hypothetical protein
LTSAALGLLAAAALPIASASAAAPLTEPQAQQVGTDAYMYGIAPLEFLRQQQLDTSVTVPNAYGNAPINQLGNQRVLSTPTNQDRLISARATRRCTHPDTST